MQKHNKKNKADISRIRVEKCESLDDGKMISALDGSLDGKSYTSDAGEFRR